MMKSYVMILLSVLGLGFLISYYAPDIDKNISSVAASDQGQSIEISLLSEKTPVPKTDVEKPTQVAKITTPQGRVITTSAGNGVQNYTISKVTTSLVASPSYSDIYRTGRLVYAHNSDNLFGNLRNLRIGSVITLTENGVTTSYKVSDIGYFTKVPYTNSYGMTGENLARCDASYNNCSGIWMGALVNDAIQHDIAMMTCDGGRNTPHRLIIFINKI